MKNLKKASIIALATESILGGIWIWLSFAEGHSGFTLGAVLHLPSVIVGVIIGEALRDHIGSVGVMLGFSIVSQVFLWTLFFCFILERSKTRKRI